MPTGQDFQKQLSAMPSKATSRGDTPILLSLGLKFEPWLLEAVAEESRRRGCSIDEAIIGALRDRFADATDAGDDLR